MRRIVVVLLGAVSLLAAGCGSQSDEERARARCVEGGAKPGSPEFQGCVAHTEGWMRWNRYLQHRIYTQ